MSRRRALITGVSGQDGFFLAERLAQQGVEVVGAVRSGPGDAPVDATVAFDLRDPGSIRNAVAEVAPSELYHLAAPTFVPDSWADPTQTVCDIAAGTAALLAAVRASAPECSVVVATSSEIFGDAGESPMSETTAMRPRNPYGVAKLAAHGLVRTMRDEGLRCSSAITFNHESVRRPERFLPRKVSRGVAAIAAGQQQTLVLGALDAIRDWSDARDIVRAYELMALAEEPGDYVLASGTGRTVAELVRVAFAAAGIDPDGRVAVDDAFVRAPESHPPVGDPGRAAQRLGWRCEIPFAQTIAEMVAGDLAALRA